MSPCASKSTPTIEESTLEGTVGAAKNGREVGSALRILAEAGCVARGFDMEDRTRRVRFLERRAIDFKTLRRRADREHQRLEQMLGYAELGGCHRARLVDHFAGTTSSPACGACAGCRTGRRRRAATEIEAEVILAVLSLVSDLNGRFGR